MSWPHVVSCSGRWLTTIPDQIVRLLTFGLATEQTWMSPFQRDARLKLCRTIVHTARPHRHKRTWWSPFKAPEQGSCDWRINCIYPAFTKEDECVLIMLLCPSLSLIPRSMDSLWNHHWNMTSERFIAPVGGLDPSGKLQIGLFNFVDGISMIMLCARWQRYAPI